METFCSIKLPHTDGRYPQTTLQHQKNAKYFTMGLKFQPSLSYRPSPKEEQMYYFLDLKLFSSEAFNCCNNAKKKNPSSPLELYINLLWFNFILGLNFIFLFFQTHYQTLPRTIKFKPWIKLNHNIYSWCKEKCVKSPRMGRSIYERYKNINMNKTQRSNERESQSFSKGIKIVSKTRGPQIRCIPSQELRAGVYKTLRTAADLRGRFHS